MADVTGDGHADLTTMYTVTNVVVVYPGQPGGTFGQAATSLGPLDIAMNDGTGHEPVAVADVNGDRRADLVTRYSDGNVYVYPGQANGAFGAPVTNFAGTWVSSQFNQTGHQMAFEKPMRRRRGCAASGC